MYRWFNGAQFQLAPSNLPLPETIDDEVAQAVVNQKYWAYVASLKSGNQKKLLLKVHRIQDHLRKHRKTMQKKR